MGEIAEGLINGDFDYITGEYLGRGMGFPRSLHDRNPFVKPMPQGVKAMKGVNNFLGHHLSKKVKRVIVKKYVEEKLGLKFEVEGYEKCCIQIQNNFGAFAQFVKVERQNHKNNE